MIDLFLLGILVVLSGMAIELKNLTHSILSLAGAGIVLGMIFFNLGAAYVSVFQILIYGGAVTILFFSLVNMTEDTGGTKHPSIKKADGIKVAGMILLIALLCLLLGLMRSYSVFVGEYTSLSQATDQLSAWVWGHRLADTIAQAFILFAAMVGILTVWRSK